MALIKKVDKTVRLNNDPVAYRGRNIQTLKKISGVAPGGALTVEFPVGNRKHGVELFCVAVNYTGGAGLATRKITGAGNDALTVTPTILALTREPAPGAGQVAIVNGGGGYAQNDRFSVVDATGAGAQFNVDTVNAGAVLTASYVAGTATASPVEPDFLLVNPVLSVGDFTPYQVDALFYSMRRQAVGKQVPLGVMPIDFTDPARNWLQANDETSWDTYGARSMTMTAQINGSAVKPGITGQEDFDWLRNSFMVGNQAHIFANPFKFSKQTVDLANGVTEIGNLVIKGKLCRLWVKLQTTPGTISAMEMWVDGQLRAQGNIADLNKRYRVYDFQFGDKTSYAVGNIATSNTLKGALNPFNFFDASYIADFDGRVGDAIPVLNSHNLKLTSSVAQKATVYIESLPGGFA